jgi:hypothetical protein
LPLFLKNPLAEARGSDYLFFFRSLCNSSDTKKLEAAPIPLKTKVLARSAQGMTSKVQTVPQQVSAVIWNFCITKFKSVKENNHERIREKGYYI